MKHKDLVAASALAIVIFLSGFIGDLGTQYIAQFLPPAELFRPFWEANGPIKSAVIAGVITLLWGSIFLITSAGIYNYFGLNIKSWSFVLFSMAVAFVLGVFVDVATNKNNWIPTLRKWYDTMGATWASTWSGGLTFAFVAFFSAGFLTMII